MRASILLLALSVALASLTAPTTAEAASYVRGELIARYDRGTPERARAALERRAGLALSRRLPGGSRELSIEDGASVEAAIARLRTDPRVEYAVPNAVARASEVIPNDPGRGSGWAAVQWNFIGPASVNAPEAWQIARDRGAPGGRGVVVAVLDTGVAYQTRGSFRRAPDFNRTRFARGYDFVDDDPYPNDENGHGTHVTGTLAESTDNGIGVTGLAYRASIMPLRVLDFQGAGDAGSIARAIRYAARRGARVINMSLEFDSSVTASQIPDIVRAIRYAHRRRVVVVAASGNEGFARVAYPARTSHVISVGATTRNLCQAEYSNSGQGLDVVAPGGGTDAASAPVGSAEANEHDTSHCRPDEGGPDVFQQTFTRSLRRFGLPPGYQGTSMASPHVSATVALVLATKRLGERPSPRAVEQHLERTARDLGPPGYDRRYGHGLIDAATALR